MKEPRIYSEDIPTLARLAEVFDYVTVGPMGDILGIAKIKLPLLGFVTISYLPYEDHFNVSRDDDTVNHLVSGNLDGFSLASTDRQTLEGMVKAAVASRIVDALS